MENGFGGEGIGYGLYKIFFLTADCKSITEYICMKLQSHKELKAWQYAYLLAKDIYALTVLFPSDERYGLVSQLRRASVSVLSNIAEGYYRRSRGEYLQFSHIALGSANEIDAQLMLAKDLNMAPVHSFAKVDNTLDTTLRLLGALCRSLEKRG